MKKIMLKQFFALLMSITMIMTNIPTVYANTEGELVEQTESVTKLARSGKLGKNNGFTWTYNANTKTLTITGDDVGISLKNGDLPVSEAEHYIFRNCKFRGSLSELFSNNKIVKSIEFVDCDTSNVTSMDAMFYKCERLERLDLSSLDISKVTDLSQMMFYNCFNLQTIHTPKKMLDTQSMKLFLEYSTPKNKVIRECTAVHCGMILTVVPESTKYTITYELNGGKNNSTNPATYYRNSETIVLQTPTRTGYTFAGWFSDSSYKTKVTQIKKGSIGNKKFYAKWTANKYNIVFNGNGATSGKMSTLTNRSYEKSYTLTTNAYKKTGYKFTGWNTKADGSGTSYADKASVKNLSSKNGVKITLYAQWNKVKYTITYELNGGTNNKDNPIHYYVTTSTKTLKSPTRKGYTFGGWYIDSKYKTKVTKIPKGSTGNKKFYAKWVANKYNIVFNGNGAKSGKMSTLTNRSYGKTYTLTQNAFKRTGYKFIGWNTKADGSGTSYTDKQSIKNLTSKNKATVTLYAQWKKVKYTITYELNGGRNNKNNPTSYYVTTATKTLQEPTRKGYTFDGWYSDSKYKTKVTQIKKGSTGNKKLYAKWTKFTPRKTPPSFTEKYYNPADNSKSTNGGKGNCVWYAYGRAYEILGEKPNFAGNAKTWWNYRESYSGYSTDVNQPREGAIIVWGDANCKGAGHVAVIEEILEDGRIVYSESAYSGIWYYNQNEKYLGKYNWYGNAVQYWGTTAMTPSEILDVRAGGTKMGFVGYIYLQ